MNTVATAVPIIEPTGCFCCGKDCNDFQVCFECGTQMYLEDLDAAHYCEKHNPERFKIIMDWYESFKNVNPQITTI